MEKFTNLMNKRHWIFKKKKSIIPYVCGGIGNQLFIYAAARRMSIINNIELIIDDKSGFERDFEYQRYYQLDHFNITCRKATRSERLLPFRRVRRYLLKSRFTYFFIKNQKIIVQNGVDFDPNFLNFKPNGITYIEGYWQSENYFKDCEEQIRNELSIKPPIDNINLFFSNKITVTNSVAIHVRFFDTSQVDSEINNVTQSTKEYYTNAIKLIQTKVINPHFYVFSDQPDRAQSVIPMNIDQVTYIKHNIGDKMAYADLWLMSKCKNFIIANSTFSWWGAWLSENINKIVIAPGFIKYEGNSYWGFKGLLPEIWIKL